MVSRLVEEGEEGRTSEEVTASGSEGPGVSSRVSMAMEISRPSTAQMVLGTEALFLPEDHPLLRLVGNLTMVQGRVVASSSGPTLTRLELSIWLADAEADALVSSLMTARADSPILEGVVAPVVLPAE